MKKIEDYLHLYLGATITTHKHFIPNGKESIGKNGFAKLTGDMLADIENETFPFNPQLVLRKLSDMSEEEINELWKVMELNPDYENESYPGFTKHKYVTEYFTREPTWPRNYERFDFKQNCTLIKYLLSKQFDLFGLIEAGLAIDKTTLK